MASSVDGTLGESGWSEFCDRHGKIAAQDFAKACVQYVSVNLPENARNSITHKDFLRKFLDSFTEQFEVDFCKRRLNSTKLLNGASRTSEELSDYSEDIESPKIQSLPKPFFRRLSFKGLRKGKFFQKQHSDEVELSGKQGSKTKLAKIVVECRKEGIVKYLTPESIDQQGEKKWERCRLALVKTVSGYMLEFYSPPKATKVVFIQVAVVFFDNSTLFTILAKKWSILFPSNRSTRNYCPRNAR